MTRYYFHVHDDHTIIDEEGQEFSDFSGALRAGLIAARALVADQIVRNGRVMLSSRIDLADAEGRVLDSVLFADAFAVVR